MGVAAGAGAADGAIVLLDCSVFSFLLHATNKNRKKNANMPAAILKFIFLFMMSPFSLSQKLLTTESESD